MTTINKSQEKSGLSSKHLGVVLLFILAASVLVLLTTFAINMLAATGDLNRLIIQWADLNNQSLEEVIKYSEPGIPEVQESYENIHEQQKYTGTIITEVLSKTPDKELIFAELSLSNIHPNEIAGLIQIFTLFSGSEEIEGLKKSWADTHLLWSQKQALMDSVIIKQEAAPNLVTEILEANRAIDSNIRRMIGGNSAILLMLKRYSLWFTVLLGILIVLIGIIYTIRGFKQIQKLKDLMLERDTLATFPELNQFPVLNVTKDGKLGYINQSARTLFPDIEDKGLDHPFLDVLKSDLEMIKRKKGTTLLKEVETDAGYYQQSFNYLSEEIGIHVHSIDITKLKKQQKEITKSLQEKEMLLAEVHHRVKNNMAIVSGLLELQEMLGEDPQKALSESLSRIKSMALVHEIVYKTDSFSEIDLQEFLDKMAGHLRLSLPNIDHVNVDNESVLQCLNINQAVPLGLLINEMAYFLCTQPNSPGEENLELSLTAAGGDDQICLKVGVPYRERKNAPDGSEETSFRMVLIENLLSQLNAELNPKDLDQTSFEVEFKPESKKGASSSFL